MNNRKSLIKKELLEILKKYNAEIVISENATGNGVKMSLCVAETLDDGGNVLEPYAEFSLGRYLGNI